MSRRPFSIPSWATDAIAGNVVEPSEIKRRAGFDTGDKPPAQWLNFQFQQIGECLGWALGPNPGVWTRAASTVTVHLVAVDAQAQDSGTGSIPWRMLGWDDGGAATSYVASHTGDEWVEKAINTTGGATFGTPAACINALGLWIVGTDAGSSVGRIWTTPRSGESGSAVDNPSTDWDPATLPGSTTPIVGIATDGTMLVAVSTAKILLSSDGLTWTNATMSGGPLGAFIGIVWTGTHWVAMTRTGQMWRVADPAGTWSAATAFFDDDADRKIACDDAGTVVSYVAGAAASSTWHVSYDHGASWADLEAPAVDQPWAVRFLSGSWWAAFGAGPYLLQNNTLDTATWTAVRMPYFASGGQALYDLALSEGAIIAAAALFMWRSGRASMPTGGEYQQPSGATALSDAAYLRGRVVSETAPTDTQVLAWDAGTETWIPTDASGTPLSDATPHALGSAAAGTATEASRADHVHAMPSAADVGAVATSLLTTRGDIITRGASAPQRLAVGSSGKVLGSDGTDPAWVTPTVEASGITDSTSAGRAVLTAADASAQRTALGLGALATQSTATVSQISDATAYGTLAARPAAASTYAGQVYYATDVGQAYVCVRTGSSTYAWRTVQPDSPTLPPTAGAVHYWTPTNTTTLTDSGSAPANMTASASAITVGRSSLGMLLAAKARGTTGDKIQTAAGTNDTSIPGNAFTLWWIGKIAGTSGSIEPLRFVQRDYTTWSTPYIHASIEFYRTSPSYLRKMAFSCNCTGGPAPAVFSATDDAMCLWDEQQWTMVAGTYDGSNLRLYINGVLCGTAAHAGSVPWPSGDGGRWGINCIPSDTGGETQAYTVAAGIHGSVKDADTLLAWARAAGCGIL